MSDPTRAEIEAIVTQPTYTVEYHDGSAWVAVPSSSVLPGVAGLINTGGGSSGLDFGANASPSVTIPLEDNATTAAIAWQRTRVRVRFGFAASNRLTRLTGIIVDRRRSYGDVPTIEWSCAGFDALISATPMYSAMNYRRLAATATTVSSVEDPTNPAYQAGLVNYIFWQAGGRPLAQAGSYPTAVFYYACDNALIAPEWTWISGEDAWQELDRLARAVGGQVFQQVDGTMRFVNVLAPTASSYTITTAAFERAEEAASTGQYFATARCSYTGRALQPSQVVYEDTTPRTIPPGGSIAFTVEPTLPIYDWSVGASDAIPTDCYVVTDYFGQAMATITATFTSRAAGRAALSFANSHADLPALLSRVSLRGRPVAPIEQGQVSYGSGTPERAIGDGEIYVQSRGHAARLCRIYADVYGVVRPTIKLTSMGYDPDRQVGEVVPLTLAAWSLTAVNHRIIEIAPGDTGARMDLSVAPITGIPTTAEMFIIGTTYSAGDTRQLGY